MADPPERARPAGSGEDVLLVTGPTEDGSGYEVLRKRADRLEVGSVHRLAEGRPLQGDVVRLSRRGESPVLFDVEVLHEASGDATADDVAAPTPGRSGPARVATTAYREGWDAIWGRGRREPALN